VSLKKSLQRAVTTPLRIIDQNKDYNLLIDASSYAVAGALTQPHSQ